MVATIIFALVCFLHPKFYRGINNARRENQEFEIPKSNCADFRVLLAAPHPLNYRPNRRFNIA